MLSRGLLERSVLNEIIGSILRNITLVSLMSGMIMAVGSDVRAWRCSGAYLRHWRASDISYVSLWRKIRNDLVRHTLL